MKKVFLHNLITYLRFLVIALMITISSNSYAASDGASLNLKNADIHSLIETVAIATGKNFIIDPRVQGKVTVISSVTVTTDELYQVFLSVLDVHGFIAAPSGSSIKIVPKINVRVSGDVTEASSDDGSSGDEIVTQVMAVKHVSAAQIVPVIRPLLPQEAHLSAYLPTNMLILSDTARNAKRVWDMVRRIDLPFEQSIEIVHLKHASAVEIVGIINSLGLNSNVPNGEPESAKRLVVADQRTNNIIINAANEQLPQLRALIAHLDSPVAQMTGNTKVVYLHYAKADVLAPILADMAAAQASNERVNSLVDGPPVIISVQAEIDTNALVITAPDAVLQPILAVIKQLDVRRAQVLVEAIIAEISSSKAEELGVQWALGSDNLAAATSFGTSGSNLIQLRANPLSLGSGLSLGVGKFGAGQLGIGALLRALSSDVSTNIISTPSLLTMDNQEAEIVVGQNVPFITGQFSSTGNNSTPSSPFQTIKREDVGLSLKIKPQINQGDSISLEILQEISSIAPSSSASDIVTNKRSIKTTVIADDGSLIILGGLIDDSVQESSEKVPFLGDLPILGAAFRYKKSQIVKRNLMVFIRTTIVRDAAILESASHSKYSLLRAQQLLHNDKNTTLISGEERPVLEKLNKIPTKPQPDEDTNRASTVNW